MGKAEGTYYNAAGSFLKELTITIDASNYPTGLYTVKYWLRFYTLGSWHEEPTQHTAIFKVIPNLCNGNHNLTVQAVLSDATCKKEGTVKKVCTVCNTENANTSDNDNNSNGSDNDNGGNTGNNSNGGSNLVTNEPIPQTSDLPAVLFLSTVIVFITTIFISFFVRKRKATK